MIEDVSVKLLESISDSSLGNLHRDLHELWMGASAKKLDRNWIVNCHSRVREGMEHRGLKHKERDKLDGESGEMGKKPEHKTVKMMQDKTSSINFILEELQEQNYARYLLRFTLPDKSAIHYFCTSNPLDELTEVCCLWLTTEGGTQQARILDFGACEFTKDTDTEKRIVFEGSQLKGVYVMSRKEKGMSWEFKQAKA